MHITSILIICGSLSLFDLVVNNNDTDRTYRATNRRKHDPSKKNHAKGSKSYQTYKPPLRSFICTTGRGQCTHCNGTVRNFRVFQDFPTSCAFDVRYRYVSRAPLWPTGTGIEQLTVSVADPYHFDTDADPDPGYEKIRYGSGSRQKQYGSGSSKKGLSWHFVLKKYLYFSKENCFL